MVSVSGFRGRVGDPLTPELVAGVAAAYGDFLRVEGSGNTVVIGRDSRTSGPMLTRAAVSGLQSVGVRVIDIGIVPTPALVLAVRDAGAAGGLGITASHNPAEWNALKFIAGEGIFLDADRMARFRAHLADGELQRAAWDQIVEARVDGDGVQRHINAILALDFIDLAAIRARSFSVAIDCVHGAGGLAIPQLLEALGCSVSGIGLDPDGHFPRDPEPTAAHLGDLCALVKTSASEIGFAVDPDVDRLSLVDEKGHAVGEDLTLALASDVVLRRTPGPVVTNLSTSRVVEDVARAHGVELIRAPVGEVNVARRMQEVSAVVGGEGNGGVIVPALHHSRDAPLGIALILQHLVDVSGTTSAVIARWPVYSIVKEKVGFAREGLEGGYAALRDDFSGSEVDLQDGLRLDWPKERAWVHIRPSGTEPVVRIIAEAPTVAGAKALVDRARRILEGTN